MDKKDLTTISIDEVENLGLSPGDVVYYAALSDKYFTLLRAGEFIPQTLVEKYRSRGYSSFYIKKIVNDAEIDFWKNLLESLKVCKNEREAHAKKRKIVAAYKEVFFKRTRPINLLDLIITNYRVFVNNSQNKTAWDDYILKNFMQFKRSLLLASLCMPLIIAMGYLDFKFLQDVFHAILFMDGAVSGSQYNLMIQKALNMDSKKAGKGVEFLKQKAPVMLPKYLKHVDNENFLLEFYTPTFTSVKDLIRFHHEAKNGTGFPAQLFEEEISDWMSVIILIDKIIDHEEIVFGQTNDNNFLQSAFYLCWNSGFEKSYGFRKVINLFKQTFEWDPKQRDKKPEARVGS